MVIGKGEAASIALAKCNNGIVDSNNMKDISSCIRENTRKIVWVSYLFSDKTDGLKQK